jgi:hypothetical protein
MERGNRCAVVKASSRSAGSCGCHGLAWGAWECAAAAVRRGSCGLGDALGFIAAAAGR